MGNEKETEETRSSEETCFLRGCAQVLSFPSCAIVYLSISKTSSLFFLPFSAKDKKGTSRSSLVHSSSSPSCSGKTKNNIILCANIYV